MWDTDQTVSRVLLKDVQFRKKKEAEGVQLPSFQENYKLMFPRDKEPLLKHKTSLPVKPAPHVLSASEVVQEHWTKIKPAFKSTNSHFVNEYLHHEIQNMPWYESVKNQLPIKASNDKYPPTYPHAQLANNPKSLGLKAGVDIKAGSKIGEYVGDLVVEARDGNNEYMITYREDTDPPLFVDSRFNGNLMRFVNHSCDPNAQVIGDAERVHADSVERLFIQAKKDIKHGDFITIKYKTIEFTCECNAGNCVSRNKI